jgi:hypothetical protein
LKDLPLILRDDSGQRDGQVVAKRKVGLARLRVLAALQNPENELVPLVAVLAEQSIDVLERGRLERLEPVPLIDVPHDGDHEVPAADIVREKIARAARRLGGCRVRVAGH